MLQCDVNEMTNDGRYIWSDGKHANFVTIPEKEDVLWFTNDDDNYYDTPLTMDMVRELVRCLSGWLEDMDMKAAQGGPAAENGKDDRTEDENVYKNETDDTGDVLRGDDVLPYVQRLNEVMENMHDNLREIGKITHEMDGKKIFGRFRQTLGMSEQSFVSSFMLYKTLMVDAVAKIYEECMKEE